MLGGKGKIEHSHSKSLTGHGAPCYQVKDSCNARLHFNLGMRTWAEQASTEG